MDNKLFWSLVSQKEAELIAWQKARKSAIAKGEPDSDPQQPLDKPFCFCITVPSLDGRQVGGRVVPLAFKFAARKIIGENGSPSHRLATPQELAEFFADQRVRRADIQAAADRAEHRERVRLVQAAEPLPRVGKG